MRNDIVEMSIADMSPELRAMIAYENNHSLDKRCPYHDIAKMVAETPVVRWEMGVGFFKMADIVAVGNHPAVVSTDPNTGQPFGMGSSEPLITLHIDGDAHRHFRKLLDPLLSPHRMAPLEATFRALTDEVIDRFIDRGRVELYEEFAVPLPATMFMRLFGAPADDLQFFIDMKDGILKAPGETFEEREVIGRQYGNRMRDRLREILAERRAESTPRDDLIGQFLTWEVDGHSLTDDEIVNIMHLFVIAGLDTVTSSITCLVAWLAQNPVERRRVMDDPSLVPAMVEELMRLESPVPSSGGRWATEDFEVNGVPIRKGDMLYLGWAGANVDPEVFDNPLTANLDRASNRHIAFAAGRHRCLGSHLARLELRCAIDQFHRRVADYEIAPGEEPIYKFEGVRHASYLPLVLTPR